MHETAKTPGLLLASFIRTPSAHTLPSFSARQGALLGVSSVASVARTLGGRSAAGAKHVSRLHNTFAAAPKRERSTRLVTQRKRREEVEQEGEEEVRDGVAADWKETTAASSSVKLRRPERGGGGGQETRYDAAEKSPDCYLWWTDSRLVTAIFQAKWRYRARAREKRRRRFPSTTLPRPAVLLKSLVYHLPLRSSVCLSVVGQSGVVGAPNTFRPRGADYIDRFMIAALLQGPGRITRGGRVKRRCPRSPLRSRLVRYLDRRM